MTDPKALYLDLMKKCLTYYIWGETTEPIDLTIPRPFYKKLVLEAMVSILRKKGIKLGRNIPFNPEARRNGADWPVLAHTMIGLRRLDNLQMCIENAIRNDVPGDLIETGVWRGGASIFMRAVLKAYGITNRTVWVADSFIGLPRPDPEKYPQDSGDMLYTEDFLRISLDEVKANFARYDLLDEQVRFLKGWFKDTLPEAPIEKLAVMRLDGDMYESTMDALTNLYCKLSVGGYVLVDDYHMKGCRKAVSDFCTGNGITDEILAVDERGAYWQRS